MKIKFNEGSDIRKIRPAVYVDCFREEDGFQVPLLIREIDDGVFEFDGFDEYDENELKALAEAFLLMIKISNMK